MSELEDESSSICAAAPSLPEEEEEEEGGMEDGWMDGWMEGERERARARKIISITCWPACRHRRSILGYELLALLRAYQVVSIKWPPNQALASPQATV